MKAILLAALVALAATPLVVAENPTTSPPKASRPKTPPAVTLGFIETRDHSIEIKAGDTGRYTVRSKDGKVLANDVSGTQLQARYPKLNQIVRGVAWNTDASVNVMRGATWNNDASMR